MKTSLIVASVLALAPVIAHADGYVDEMKADAQAKDWGGCLMNYKGALHHGVKDSDDLRAQAAACLEQAKHAKNAQDYWLDKLSTYVGSYRGDIDKLQKGESASYDTVKGQADACDDVVTYAEQILDPTTPLVLKAYQLPDWKGTVSEAHAICAQGSKVADDIKAKLLGPFIKAGLKNDKLDMIAEHITSNVRIPGGEATQDPRKLARANVWFFVYEGDACANGTISNVERYQFGADQKIAKSSTKSYCGDVPASAYH